MKTTKPESNSRRSLRNVSNVTKTTKPETAPSKGKVSKTPNKNSPNKLNLEAKTPVTPASKRKKVDEEKESLTEGEDTNLEKQEGSADNVEENKEKAKKPKVKRQRKKNPEKAPDEGWRTLDDLGDSEESKKKAANSQKAADRRKQALVERDVACTVMVQTLPVAKHVRKNDDDSDCEVLDKDKCPETVEVDLDEDEAGSNFCEIIDETTASFDYKRLVAQYTHVTLPSTLWACHADPRKQFVSFTRFNPDFPERGTDIVDRAVVFRRSLKPDVYCNGEPTTLPDEIHCIETLTNISQVLQHLNAMIIP